MNHLEGYECLERLAMDLLWSWKHGADRLWQELDALLWESTHNPWVVLQTVSRQKLAEKLADPAFNQMMHALEEVYQQEQKNLKWFQQSYPKAPLTAVAYFSMEFMLSEALPIYSGGLGNVAGDQLKAASDLGVPVIGIGLLYSQGYFRQVIDSEGNQQAFYPFNDPGQLPITPLRKANGEWLRIEISLPGYDLFLRTWQVQVGRVKLFLLDSNDAANFAAYRGITSELYGGSDELRLQQEILLGIGGFRLLEMLGIQPEVCHLNEGHAAFAVLERAKCMMQRAGASFAEAMAATRAGNLFTTHTAVPAGFDRFDPELIEQYLGKYAKEQLKISVSDLLALGRKNPHDPAEPFNMAYLAIRGSGAVNGVSRLHSKVSRQIFEGLFPHWPEEEVPVTYVTNGVHAPSWDSISADNLWTEASGKSRWLGTVEKMEREIQAVSTAKLWQMRNTARQSLVEFARSRLQRQLAVRGGAPEEIERVKHLFDPHTLTLGFARRFATYKRPNLLLHDPERLLRILTHTERPVQLLIAGKAHPADKPGQALIKEWMQFIRRPEVRAHVIFLSDYDMLLTEQLVQGVDVWVNTPRRPWEACGTSGMKVLVNGGLNLSELDGWWAEAYAPEVGWALGDGREHGEDPTWDAADAQALYDLLEQQVVPEFYNRDAEGIPLHWIARIRESMARLTPYFSANRAVRQYTEQHYLPAAAAFLARKGKLSQEIVAWQQALENHWVALRFSQVEVETKGDQHLFEVQLYLSSLSPDAVKVELYADGIGGNLPVRQPMSYVRELSGSMHLYRAAVGAMRPASYYTPRAIPTFSGVAVPLEATQILWQKR